MHKFKIRAIRGTIAYEKYNKAVLTVIKNCCHRIDDYGHVDYIEPNGDTNGWATEYFELAFKPEKEADYLDCFQRNFSDGV